MFQIAAHEGIVPVPQLYEWCEVAYELTVKGLGLGRVIARPFIGLPGAFARTAESPRLRDAADRRDAARPAGGARAITSRRSARWRTCSPGKGISSSHPTRSDDDGLDRIESLMATQDAGVIFANLVDFDAVYGHRNDTAGYAANLERFDARLAGLLPRLRQDDLLIITADHGNDPTTPSTDHSREHVPLLVQGKRVRAGVDLGTRATFADLGQTLAENFGVGRSTTGRAFCAK